MAWEEPEELNYQIDVDVEGNFGFSSCLKIVLIIFVLDLDMESVDEERAIKKMKGETYFLTERIWSNLSV